MPDVGRGRSIVIVEPTSWGLEHASFNCGLIETVRLAFPEADLSFWGELEHLQQVRLECRRNIAGAVTWRPIRIAARRVGLVRRVWEERRLFKQIGLASEAKRTLILSSVLPATLIGLRACGWDPDKGTIIQGVLHGVAAQLSGRRPRNPLRRLRSMRTAIRILSRPGIQFLVLEAAIRDAILEHNPILKGRIEVLEHPIPLRREAVEGGLRFPLRLGFLGLASAQKGFPLFARVAASVKNEHPSAVEFHAVGRWAPNCESVDIGGLTTPPVSGRISVGEYWEAVAGMSFVVFPFEDHYQFSASGSLMDAVACGRPIIARRLPLFERLFETYGDIGHLFDTEEELVTLVSHLVTQPDPVRYRTQRLNLGRLASARKAGSQASAYRRIHEMAVNMRQSQQRLAKPVVHSQDRAFH